MMELTSKESTTKLRKFIERICCDCKVASLVRNDTKADRCRKCHIKKYLKRKTYKNMIGDVCGKLTVIKIGSQYRKLYKWICKCECGKTVEVNGSRLRSGRTKSCGCITKSRNGLSSSRIFRIWKAMLQRCYDPKVNHFDRYGAVGIKVCDEWHNFENFLKDMGNPSDNLTLDRIDNTKGYSISNCRWATYKQQSSNKKNNFFITAFGQTKTLQQWADEKNIKWSTLRKRIISNWDVEKALTYPVRTSNNIVKQRKMKKKK